MRGTSSEWGWTMRGVTGGMSLVVAVLAAGCSGGDGRVAVYPVQGKVTVGGEAPSGALVVLYPVPGASKTDIRPSARVGRDGSFKVTTYEADDGAPAGEYTATIQWNKLVKKGGDYAAGPDVIPAGYGSPDRSEWKVRVASAANDLPAVDIRK
jgi:hypothetical protein